MITVNQNYTKLEASYLFSDIEGRISEYQANHPEKGIIKLGIGDCTRALPGACIRAFHRAIDEMADDATFRGYGPEQGYSFLRDAIAENDFQARGIDIRSDEVFVSDGAKCDTGNFQEILSGDVSVAVPDPVYPVYVDTNVMAGRAGELENGRYQKITYLDSTKENDYVPAVPTEPVDLIYLCFPNNPTGATITRDALAQWVDYARDHRSLILFDAAYEAFIRDDAIPHSIYEIDGAREVAVEFRSFSKTAGFTGTRCAFTVVPEACKAYDEDGNRHDLHALWNRRQSTKFNGVSYPVQRAAEAVYSVEGNRQVRDSIDYYLRNAARIRQEMASLGFSFAGGVHSPYIWVHTERDSWDFFDMLLARAGVVCTPGAGFGSCGDQYVRISAFNSSENVEAAMDRITVALDA